jgi:hypothetical protein
MREFGDFLDEGWCGSWVVEDEGEVLLAIELRSTMGVIHVRN